MALTQIPDELIVRSVASVSGATQANPCVITATAHGFENGDEVYLVGLGGMVELNNRAFTVANKGDDTLELSGEDSSAHTAYTSGGSALQRLGTAVQYNVGTAANQLVALDAAGKLPAVDGSQLVGLNLGSVLFGTKNLQNKKEGAFTGIPSSARRVMLVLEGSKFNNPGDYPIIQLGNSSGYITSGYSGALFMDKREFPNNEEHLFSAESGFRIGGNNQYTWGTGNVVATFTRGNGDSWTASITGSYLTLRVNFVFGAGSLSVSPSLDRIRVMSEGGSVTWEEGNASVYYH